MHIKLLYTLLIVMCSASYIFAGGSYRVIRGERPVLDYQKLQEKDYEEGVLVIKFRMDYENHLEASPMYTDKDGIVHFQLENVDRLTALYGVRSAQQHFSSAAFRDGFTPRHKAWGFHLWYRLELDDKAHIPSVVEEFARLREIEIAEPELRKEIIGTHNEEDFTFVTEEELQQRETWTPNDPQFVNQWHYYNTGQQNGTPGLDISLREAWTLEKGDTAVIVAIIDGGIDYNHNDLAGNMWYQIGFNFVNNTPNIEPHNHGTHVAGTISAVNNNNLGVAGVAGGSGDNDGVRLMSCQVFASSTNGGFHIAPVYAADNGASISQNSWGYTSPGFFEQSVLDAIDYFNINGGGEAMDGGITIFAAGNSNSSASYYPGFYSGAFSVAGTNNNDQKSWYSNFGSWIDISAPGGETNTVTQRGVLSTLNNNQYGYYQGTSMACPHVSGVVALMLSSVYGEFSPEDVMDILINTTDNHYGANPGFIGQLGAGRLNAHHAVALSQLYLTLPSNPSNFTAVGTSDSQIDLSWLKNDEGDNVLLAWSPNGVFGIPQESEVYQPGDNIEGGGNVLYIGDAEAFVHENLNAATIYYYRLWSVNADTLYSMGRGTHTYTQCGVTLLPVFETFSGSAVPYCWAFPNGQGNWKMVSSRGNPAPAIEFNWSPSVTNYEFSLESPPLDGNIPGSAIALEFDLWLNNYNTNTVEQLLVQVYDGEDWVTVMSFNNTGGDIPWDTYFVDITPHVLNQTFMVRFTAQGANSFNINYWVIDNFNVFSFSCPQPTDLVVSDITTDSSVISWTPVGEEDTWDVVWGATGFDPNTGGNLVSGLQTTVYSLEGLETFTHYQVYVRADCGEDDISSWAGPITFQTLATCPAPVNLTVSQVTASSAQVDWDPVGAETEWDLVWGPAGFNPNTHGTMVEGITDSQYQIPGLEQVTPYDVYVRAFCGEEDVSLWLGPASFTTICDVFTLPFTETFGSESVNCWSFPLGQGNWGFGSSYAPPSSTSGAPYATFTWNPSQVGYSFALTSPLLNAINLEEAVKLDFVLFINNFNNTNINYMSVEYKAFEANEWQELEIYSTAGLGSGNIEHLASGMLIPGMQGQLFQVRFRAHGENSYSINGWSIDDVSVYQELTEECYEPVNIEVLEITSTTANIFWTPQGVESTWEILYGEHGFDTDTEGTLVENITESSYLLGNLEQSTPYDVYVRAVCDTDNFSGWAGPADFVTEVATYTITFSIEGPGFIYPEDDTTVEHGEDLTVHLDHLEGAHIVDVLLDDNSVMEQVDMNNGTLVLQNIVNHHHVHAVFAMNSYDLVLTAQPAHGGTVSGAGTYDHYSDITVEAIPAEDFNFVHWEDENGVVVSNEAQFSFMIPEYVELTAFFQHVTSTTDLGLPAGVSIYPNPAQDHLWIEFEYTGQEDAVVTLYTIDGREVARKTLQQQGQIKLSFNLEGLQPGVYMVRLGHLNLMEKVIIR